jgi:diguanylate cyclase (GGDEF)-like protein
MALTVVDAQNPKHSRSRELHVQNAVLRQKLDELMDEARRNERKLRRFESLELRLVGLSSLLDVVKLLIFPDRGSFQWDVVTLTLLDPQCDIRRMLESEGANLADYPNLVLCDDLASLSDIYPHSLFPTLGPYRHAKHAALFETARSRPTSVALLPLVRYGKLIGSLNIGSLDAERFSRGARTDFFEHFAAIVAICVENAANVQRLRHQGLTDTLTAINNRRFFDQRLQEEVDSARRYGQPLSCMLLDVDYFKRVNDTYGHQTGDLVLREVASLIRAQLRGSDVLSRYGGEEFAALLSKANRETAAEAAERIRRQVAEHAFRLPDGRSFNVTISIGISTYTPSSNSPPRRLEGEELVGLADRCLYQAKEGGRNRVVAAGDFLPPDKAANE